MHPHQFPAAVPDSLKLPSVRIQLTGSAAVEFRTHHALRARKDDRDRVAGLAALAAISATVFDSATASIVDDIDGTVTLIFHESLAHQR